jgi:hypothetical protein
MEVRKEDRQAERQEKSMTGQRKKEVGREGRK